jgi:alkanesulfonate monooxygenase
MSGYPHIEEAYRFAKLMFPLLHGKKPVTMRSRPAARPTFAP